MQPLDCLSWFEGFEPHTMPGLTAREFTQLCANLYDLTRKIGEIIIPSSRFVVQTPSSPIRLAASLEPTDLLLEVWRRNYRKSETIMQPFAAKRAFVLWEAGLPTKDVRNFLLAADLELHACGKFVGGVRERTNALVVEERFPKGQHAATILTTQTLRSATFVGLYDHPDRLVVISDPFGNDMICRADERTYMERHVLVQQEVFQELDIPDVGTLLALSEETRVLVRQRVGNRLARLLQELN